MTGLAKTEIHIVARAVRRVLLVAFVAALAALPVPAEPEPPAPAQHGSPIPAPAGSPAPPQPGSPAPASTLDRDQVAALAERIAPIVEQIRGGHFKHPVPVEVVDDAAARTHFESRLAKYWPERRIRAEEIVYAHLGLLPPKTDLAGEVYDVLEEQASGFYDPDRDTFFVLGDMPAAAAPIIMAHELTHALDDQTFGIERLLESAGDSNDRAGAIDCVVEGSGTAVMSVFVVREIAAGRLDPKALAEFRQTDAGRGERLKQAPLFVQRELVAPYILGMAFLLRGEMIRMKTGGITPSDIDRAFRDPPRSTEQILHPEKYWDEAKRDLPRVVTLPDLSGVIGPGWTLEATGDLGELTIALLTGVDPGDPTSTDRPLERWTNAAASGWGGDLWQLYRDGDRAVTVLATVWDSDRDAREFESALRLPPGALTRRRADVVIAVAGDDTGRGGALLGRAIRSIGTGGPVEAAAAFGARGAP
jgi:hypothetical protein